MGGLFKEEKTHARIFHIRLSDDEPFGVGEQKGWFFQKVDTTKNKGCLKPIRAFLDSVQNLKNQKTTNFLLYEK